MKYNRLGNSDISVSEIGMGCMSLDLSKLQESQYLIHQALDNGINYFDTADLYNFGDNERFLGETVKGKRENLIIATKVGNKWNADKTGWSWDVSSDYIYKAVDESLKRLKTDYIDLYQIHGGTKEDGFDEILSTLENLIKQGKIRTYGISSIRPNVFLKYINHSHIASNMMQYSLLDTRPEEYLDKFYQKNISILARGAFAQGILLGKPSNGYLDHNNQAIQTILDYLEKTAKKYSVTKQAIALSYLTSYKGVTSAVVGIRTKEQLIELLEAESQLSNFDFSDWTLPKISYTSNLI